MNALKKPSFFSSIMTKMTEGNDLIIKTVITINMAMFGIAAILSGRNLVIDLNPLVFMQVTAESLIRLGATGSVPLIDRNMYWTLLSAGYIHANLLHIVFNMLAFMSLGRLVSTLYGATVMFTVYTISTITGFLVSGIAGVQITIGASAGICGLIGAALIYGTIVKDALAIAVKSHTTGWIVSLVIMGLLIPKINNWGHAGGFAGGALYALIILKTAGTGLAPRIHSILFAISVLATLFSLIMALM